MIISHQLKHPRSLDFPLLSCKFGTSSPKANTCASLRCTLVATLHLSSTLQEKLRNDYWVDGKFRVLREKNAEIRRSGVGK